MRPKTTWWCVAVTVGAVVTLLAGVAGAAAGRSAGPQGDGTAVTPVGYRVTPAGQQTNLGDLPLALALSPDGHTLLASNDGQGTQSLQVIDPATSQVAQTISYSSPEALFYGLAWSPDGGTVYASAGGNEKIRVYHLAAGRLTEGTPISLPTTNPVGIPVNLYPAGVQATPDGARLVVADHLADSVSVVDVGTGATSTVPVGHNPLAVVLSPDGRKAYVTDQGGSTVSVLDLAGAVPAVEATITVGTHPNGEVLDRSSGRLYVANGDSDDVSVIDTSRRVVVDSIDLAPYPHANVGTNPVGLSLSPDGRRLYVANSGNNDVDVVDTGRGRVRGSIPTGWYPSAVVATASTLFVASAKGLGAGPNDGPGHPNPTLDGTGGIDPSQYVGSMMTGTLSTLPLPVPEDRLARDTSAVARNDRFAGESVGAHPAQAIQHVIYVVRENRTYDQELGSLGQGNGDAALNLFGDDSATNSRALARKFVTLDNFYADAEVSAQGWNWDVAANSNPFSETVWPADYSGRNAPYPSESSDPAIAPNRTPSDGYIWDHLADAGVTFRNYGFYVSPDALGAEVAGDPVLNARTDHAFHGYDLRCPDSPGTFAPMSLGCGGPRISEWQREFHQYVAGGNLPTVELVRLPNDHTAGTKPGAPSPLEYVADNDLALGTLVDAVSHSPYWKNTAIFVTEDDAQNGPDHVDAHRTTSLLISPYTQSGRVDSTFYSTVSMLRTIEDIVGIRPLTQFDAFATPMGASFGKAPNLAAYSAVRPPDAGGVLQSAGGPLAAFSAQLSPTVADQLDAQTFNQAIWQSVRGAGSEMPAPRHSLDSRAADLAGSAGPRD